LKKFSLLLIALLLIGLALMAIVVLSGSNGAPPFPVFPSKPGVSAVIKERVISVALADPSVQKFFNTTYEKVEPEYTGPGGTGIYTNESARYAGVSFHANAGGEPISLNVIVDTESMKEMAVFYNGLPNLLNSWVIIPPGNGIYSMMISSFNLSSPNKYAVPEIGTSDYPLNITPGDAKLYPLIVNENNLGRYLNGSAYEVPELIDPQTGDRVKVDGSMPLGSLRGHYILPPEIQSYQVSSGINTWYYLILVNKETDREVKIVYTSPFPPIYQ